MVSASTQAARWIEKWPQIAITGGVIISMGVWWKRKAAGDPELRSHDSRAASGGMSSQPAGGVEQGYGRKSAEATGMLEGDRPYQGIFPTKKITTALEGVLPASKEGHPSRNPILEEAENSKAGKSEK